MAHPTPQEGPDRPGGRAVGPTAPNPRRSPPRRSGPGPPGAEQPREEAVYATGPLALRWGATRLSTGKVVWFEQQLPRDLRMEIPDD